MVKEKEKKTKEKEKEQEVEPKELKIGIIMSGGIQSGVTLETLKRMSDRETQIQPIVITGEGKENDNDTKDIKRTLEHMEISSKPKSFSDSKADSKDTKKEILRYCIENNINHLAFPTSYEDSLDNEKANDMLEWRTLSSELNNNAVTIYEPHRGTLKSDMIIIAGKLGILEETDLLEVQEEDEAEAKQESLAENKYESEEK